MSTAEELYDDPLGEDFAASGMDRLDVTINDAVASLKTKQADDGHWAYELEADATIPSEYIFLEHYLDEIDDVTEEKLARYLREIQSDRHGGWPLFYEGDLDISASVKAYFALKLVGDHPDEPHMARAREAILSHGGAAKVNVFTRTALALFGQVPWRAVPVMPVEIMLLPKWAPFHMSKVSYWSRTVIAPLLILMSLKPQARNPRGVNIRELFVTPPEEETGYLSNHTKTAIGAFFLTTDKILRFAEPFMPRATRDRAIQASLDFIRPRLNGEHGLGGIFPAMANTVMAFDALGIPGDDPEMAAAKRAIRNLLVFKGDRGYCQPCMSPVWDTGLIAHTLLEAEGRDDNTDVKRGLDWLVDRQITEATGDWTDKRPNLRPGGWAFEYRNDHYPDVDDTAMVAMAIDRLGAPEHRESVERAAEWIIGMQSENGGWGSFDVDNTHYYLNAIPFADHGALLDPPTSDVTGRCLAMLGQLGYKPDHPNVARAVAYLKSEQEEDGSWYGRWGTNYIYGTWSVLGALNVVGEDMRAPYIRKSVDWLLSRQNSDGGWGEDGSTYDLTRRDECKSSTPSQTSWALLTLMTAGEVDHPAVKRGVDYLINHQRDGERWEEEWYTAVGFPRVFYLRYHGYAAYFPIWALARYRNLTRGNSTQVLHGM